MTKKKKNVFCQRIGQLEQCVSPPPIHRLSKRIASDNFVTLSRSFFHLSSCLLSLVHSFIHVQIIRTIFSWLFIYFLPLHLCLLTCIYKFIQYLYICASIDIWSPHWYHQSTFMQAWPFPSSSQAWRPVRITVCFLRDRMISFLMSKNKHRSSLPRLGGNEKPGWFDL